MEILVQKEVAGASKRRWGAPTYRVSHVSAAWQPRVVHVTIRHAANTGFISTLYR